MGNTITMESKAILKSGADGIGEIRPESAKNLLIIYTLICISQNATKKLLNTCKPYN
jgi:hypothetical protein